MPISESKDKEKSRENEAIGSSSAKAEKIISGKPESKTNQSPSGTKVFSSFQVGKQHPKEEEYLAFTRYIYNLPEESGETYGVLGTTSLFPRISIFPNGIPGFTAQLFEFGYLDRAFPKLRLPDEKDNLVLQTDASDYHWGALLQTDLNEICRYTSGTFNDAETRYSTNEKELLAIVRGIRKSNQRNGTSI